MTKLRAVTVDSPTTSLNGSFKTTPMASNTAYNGDNEDRSDHNVLGSHYWIKPVGGISECDTEISENEMIINLSATVYIVE